MTNPLTNSVAWTAGAFLSNQVTLRAGCLTRPRPMPHQFAAALEHPLRLKYRKPAEELGRYGCGAGLTVLDLGCGTGLYTVEMARLVGEHGAVHAVDLQQPMLDRTQRRITTAGLPAPVYFHWAGAYQLPMADASVDLAVLVATLPQIPNRLLALAELSRVLKTGGRLAISEEMPDPAYVPPKVIRRWVEAAGFHFGGQSGTWFCYHQIYFNEH